ncbi:hypothetical protein Tco_0879750 [Tanacetum coccineum]
MTTIIHCLKKVYKLGKINVADDALSRKADDELGDEGLFSERTKLNSIFITAEKTPSKNKELAHLRRSKRLEDQSTAKEKARRERSKPKRKRSRHQETSLDFEYEEGSDDAFEDLNSPYKRPKPTPFTQRITRFKYRKRAKLPRNIRQFRGAKSEVLGRIFTTKGYAKDPTEIHGIKRRQNEGLQAFMARFKSEISHIKGVPPVLRISAFMHGNGRPELAKKLNDKIPKMVDKMFKRVRAFIRGEVVAESA